MWLKPYLAQAPRSQREQSPLTIGERLEAPPKQFQWGISSRFSSGASAMLLGLTGTDLHG